MYQLRRMIDRDGELLQEDSSISELGTDFSFTSSRRRFVLSASPFLRSPFSSSGLPFYTSFYLVSQGYVGQGLELRPRKTWSRYPALTQSRLRKQAINPTVLLKQCAEEDGEGSPFEKGSFFIGNHADEMTVRSLSPTSPSLLPSRCDSIRTLTRNSFLVQPWIPVIAALTPESGFLNIPCCLCVILSRFSVVLRS